MKKFVCILLVSMLCIATALCCVGCAKPSMKSLIVGVDQFYFQNMPQFQIDMTEYVNDNGAEITYVATSDNECVEPSVDGTKILAKAKGDGAAIVTIDAMVGGSVALSLEWEIVLRPCKTVVCVGDSLTHGAGRYNEAYPVFLQEYLGESTRVVNCGLDGANITGFGGHGKTHQYITLTGTLYPQYKNSIIANPDIIVIMLGTNDATGWKDAEATYYQEFCKLIESYQEQCPDAQIVLVVSPPTLNPNGYNIPNDVIKANVNPIQRQLAEEYELVSIDMRELFETHEGGYEQFFVDDGVHFNVPGSQFVAQEVANVLWTL